MPWCPQCRYEYIEGIEICPECGVPLVEALPPLPPAAPFIEGLNPLPKPPLILLYMAESERMADELAALLQSSGIAATTQSVAQDYFVKYYTGRSMGAAGVYVSEQEENLARELLGLDESPIPFLYREAESVEPLDWEDEGDEPPDWEEE